MFEDLSDSTKITILIDKFRDNFRKAMKCEEPLPELWEGGFDKLKKLIKESRDYENEIRFTVCFIKTISDGETDFWWRIQEEMADICENGVYTKHRNKMRKLRRKIIPLNNNLRRRMRCEEMLEREMRRFGKPPEYYV